MSALDNARRDARAHLQNAAGDARPAWRTCFDTDGADEPTSIAPVCPDEDHEAADGSVYSCCPDPVIECDSYPLAAYLVELLNADRGAA